MLSDMLRSNNTDYIKLALYSLRIYFSVSERELSVQPLINYNIMDIFKEILKGDDKTLVVSIY
jgi:hypothetical protein